MYLDHFSYLSEYCLFGKKEKGFLFFLLSFRRIQALINNVYLASTMLVLFLLSDLKSVTIKKKKGKMLIRCHVMCLTPVRLMVCVLVTNSARFAAMLVEMRPDDWIATRKFMIVHILSFDLLD